MPTAKKVALTPPPDEAPRKRGPKPKPEGEKAIKTTISLHPRTHEALIKRGRGTLSRGIEETYQDNVKLRAEVRGARKAASGRCT